MRALIVDDAPEVQDLLDIFLKDAGFEVHRAENGLNALELLVRRGAMDVALVDLFMPVMDGFEFVRVVRSDRAYDGMRIVMVTTASGARPVLQALRLGADEYVEKPFNKETILAKFEILGILPKAGE